METIHSNKNRVGNFTSSKIAALMAEPTQAAKNKGEIWGKAALTYIKQKKWERRLGRSLTNETNARPTTWGKLLEQYIFENVLGTEYELMGDVVIVNPEIDYHAGAPDALKHMETGRSVVDTKAPETLNSFCTFYDCNTIEDVINNHDDGETYFYQLVSNAILTNSDKAELIIFAPYKSELETIRKMAEYSGEYKYSWIVRAEDSELPYLPDGCDYNHLKVIAFDVTTEMKDALKSRILAAGKLLNAQQ